MSYIIEFHDGRQTGITGSFHSILGASKPIHTLLDAEAHTQQHMRSIPIIRTAFLILDREIIAIFGQNESEQFDVYRMLGYPGKRNAPLLKPTRNNIAVTELEKEVTCLDDGIVWATKQFATQRIVAAVVMKNGLVAMSWELIEGKVTLIAHNKVIAQ